MCCKNASASSSGDCPDGWGDQAVTIEDRMDGAFGGNPDIAVEPTDQQLADLACAPVRFVGLQPDNQAFDLLRQLVGVAHRSA